MKVVVLVLVFLTVGCHGPLEDRADKDQCIYREAFDSCLEKIPPGPDTVHYNDWSEVIDECSEFAHSVSVRPKKMIKDECKQGWY